MTSVEDDDIPQLSADTLEILQAFLKEKEEREKLELEGGKDVNFEEDWVNIFVKKATIKS